jgi:pimeloyl-ACP methyl ester carboxylesterase
MSFLLLPGAGGDASYWSLVEPLLRDAGQDVVAVSLPAADDDAGLGEYVDAAVTAAGDRPGPFVVVAQSLGAVTAPLLCGVLDVCELVLVAPMILSPGETAGTWWTSSGQVAARRAADVAAGRDPDRAFDPVELFLGDLPPAVLEDLLARPAADQSGTPMEQAFPLDAWPDVPTRVVAGRRDRLLPLGFMRELAAERLGPATRVDVVESGHLPALVVPQALAALLLTAR